MFPSTKASYNIQTSERRKTRREHAAPRGGVASIHVAATKKQRNN